MPMIEAIADLSTPLEPIQRECMCTTVHPKAGALCRSCRAFTTGSNCWEMTMSPCCDLNRTTCEGCPIFAGAMRAVAESEWVAIALEGGGRVEGEVHMQRHRRLSDAFNDGTKPYIVVTNATITYPDPDRHPPERREVLFLLKSAARIIHPLEAKAT
jgi:hypothetical protein